jgi:hypothetical protein
LTIGAQWAQSNRDAICLNQGQPRAQERGTNMNNAKAVGNPASAGGLVDLDKRPVAEVLAHWT